MMLAFIINMIVGSLTLALQQVLVVRFNSYVSLVDVMLVFFVFLIMLGSIDLSRWLFITAFLLGGIVSVWAGRPLGFDSLVYGIPVYFFHMTKNNFSVNILSFLAVFFGMVISKAILYVLLGVIFRHGALSAFIWSRTFLYSIGASLAVSLIIYFVISIIFGIWRRPYVE